MQLSGQAGVADIKSVTIDNKVVSLTPTNYRGIYYLPVGDDLAVNSDHEITVVAENLYGKTLISVPFSLINLLDSLSRIWKKRNSLLACTSVYGPASQTAGDKCTLFTTEENANAYLAGMGKNQMLQHATLSGTMSLMGWSSILKDVPRSNWIL